MIIVMLPGASADHLAAVEERVRQSGLEPHTIHGTERHVVAVVGDERPFSPEHFAVLPGVDKVMPVLAPYKLASIEVARGRSEVKTAPRDEPGYAQAVFGPGAVTVVAGPCTVESRAQVIETAEAVWRAGAKALRGGAFKPRTSPYSFQGLEEKGLEYLADARARTGLPIITEVVTPEDVPLVARYADMLQLGARNMQNYLLLKAVGEARRPVLLKRGMAAALEELLLAAEYILKQGNEDVVLCERGIRTFEQHCRNTLSLSVVPALRVRTHLPLVVDPSHGTGHSYMVPPMSRAAIAAGADGLIVEVHPDPRRAKVDGGQSLSFGEFESLMKDVAAIAKAVGRTV
jgi:3-deoxy-7-phosphoheptulonate synthase